MDEKKLELIEDQIGKALRESESSGELRRARDWGKPIDFGDGYDETPADLRMGFKVLKDAGVVPPEVDMMQRLGEMRARLAELDARGEEAATLAREIHDLQITVALRIESLAKNR